MVDGYLNFNTKINTKGFDKGKKEISNGIGSLKSSLKGLAVAVAAAFSIKAVTSFGKKLIETSAEVRAETAQFTQTFGELGQAADEAMQRVADSSGIVKTRLRSTGTQIYAFAKASGMDAVNAIDMMETSLQVAADSAAYYDRSLEDVSESLRSFLKGNYANDAALGVSATETTRNAKAMQLYGKSFMELSEAQKQLTLLQMVKDANDLSGATGQAAREAEGWENVLGNLKETWRQLLAVVGQPVLRVATIAVQRLTAALDKMLSSAKAVVGTLNSLMGIEEESTANVASNINNSVNSQNALTDSVAKTGKELKRTIAGFDELNVIASETADIDSGNEASIVSLPVLDTSKTENQLSKLSEDAKKYFEPISSAWETNGDELVSNMKRSLQNIKELLADIAESWNKVWLNGSGERVVSNIIKLLSNVFGLLGDVADAADKAWNSDGAGTALIQSYYDKWNAVLELLNTVGGTVREVWNNGTGEEFFGHIYSILTNINDVYANLADNSKIAWESNESGRRIVQGIFDIFNGILGTIEEITGATAKWSKKLDLSPLTDSLANLVEALKPLTKKAGDGVAYIYKKALLPISKIVIEKALPDSINAISSALGLLNTILTPLKPLGEWLVGFFKILAKSKLDTFTKQIERFTDVVSKVNSGLKAVGDWMDIDAEDAEETFRVLGEEIRGQFDDTVEWVDKKKTSIKKTFDGFSTDIKNAFKDTPKEFKEKFSEARTNVEGKFKDIGSWFGSRYSEIKNAIKDAPDDFKSKFSDARANIESKFNGIGSWFSSRYTDIKNAFPDVPEWFKKKFEDAWTNVSNVFSWHNINEKFSSAWQTIKDCFWNVEGWFKDTFQKAFDKIGEVFSWSNISNTFNKVWDYIKSVSLGKFEKLLEKIEDGINFVIDGFNSIASIKIPSGPWGKGFTIGLGTIDHIKIPALATGTVVPANYGEFLAVLGDNKREAEVVSPLSTIKQAVSEAWKESGNSSKPVVINTYLFPNSRAFHQEVIDITKEESQRSGL